MKNKEINQAADPEEKKDDSANGNAENKLKKSCTAASISNIITSAVRNVKARSGRGLANEGTNVDYEEER